MSIPRVLLTACLILGLVFGLSSACDQAVAPHEMDGREVEQASNHKKSSARSENSGIQGLTAVRNSTEKYKDVSKAEADGYTLFSPFVPNMGFHYLHESAMNEDGSSDLDRRLNRTKPEILVYSDKTPDNSGKSPPNNEGFAAVEYAIPKRDGETTPPQHAIALFNNADSEDWHVHPNHHEIGLGHDWTVHAECHYEGGIGVFLVETPGGNYELFAPPNRAFGSWSGEIKPDQCPTSLGMTDLPPLLIVHGKWWTLHAWIWVDNPEGIFHPTNPDVQS